MKTYIVLASAILITGIAGAQTELKGTAEQLTQHLTTLPRVVTLTSEAELKRTADRASVLLHVITESKSLQEAARLNQEVRARMSRVLAERGIPAERMQASKFSSTPKYGVFGEKAKSYRVDNAVRIAANDDKEFQIIAGLVDTMPEVRYDSIEFDHSNKERIKAQALEMALEKAGERQRLYELKLGVKLTVKGFLESGAAMMPMSAVNVRKAYSADLSTRYTSVAGQDFDGEGAEAPTAFAELVYRAQVTVEYAVTPKDQSSASK